MDKVIIVTDKEELKTLLRELPIYIGTGEAAALANQRPQTLYDKRTKRLIPDGVCTKGPAV